MIGFGVFLIIGGIASLITGIVMNNDVELQMKTLFESGSMNPGTVWIIIGGIALALGFIFLIAGIVRKIKDNESRSDFSEPATYQPSNRVCANCGEKLSAIADVCPKCGKICFEEKK